MLSYYRMYRVQIIARWVSKLNKMFDGRNLKTIKLQIADHKDICIVYCAVVVPGVYPDQ